MDHDRTVAGLQLGIRISMDRAIDSEVTPFVMLSLSHEPEEGLQTVVLLHSWRGL